MTLISYQSAMLLFIEENSGNNVKEAAQVRVREIIQRVHPAG
jgi:hypothetical protein